MTMPSIYLSPSTQEYNPYITGAGSEEHFMNLIADAMEPYLTANTIRFGRNTPEMTAASSIRQGNAGNYDFYLEERDKNRSQEAAPEILRKEKEPAAKATPAAAAPQTAQPEKKMEKKPEKKPYSPAEAQKLLPQVELKIREYEALQKVLSDKIADPANQQDLETSTKLAEEYAEQSKILDGLMDKWEKLMESLE